MTNLNAGHVAVLTALRAATVLKREPGTLTPDGHRHWFTLAELANEGRFDFPVTDAELAQLSRTARGLYKLRLVASRTNFTHVSYRITEAGLLALAAYEADRGLSAVAAAELDLEQAIEDEKQARKRIRQATDRLAVAHAERERNMR